jgi:DNA helicase II / ATP-dependent DNA helicase PcrA
MSATTREEYQQLFQAEFDKLNPSQLAAVNEIYGPVMVIAGPGTGKTQLLALRICNILTQTDMNANNILCLTYTESGAVAMRNRLIRFIGAEAFKIGIFTYHGFCNKIIRENPDVFGIYKEFSNADEVEIVETIIDMIKKLPLEHELRRNTGDELNDVKRFKKVFDTMKTENWSESNINQAIEEYLQELPNTEGFFYKIKSKYGQPRTDLIEKKAKSLNFVKHASALLDEYNLALNKKDLIDFNDSILWVIKALKENEDLKLRYQEQYQFVLADEYQDTNGVQNEILFQLVDYDESPNIFVVGDDDQAIFRFQGANVFNIESFKNKFNPAEFVLDINYRSTQSILDGAMSLISHNQERMAFKYEHLNKNLTSGLKPSAEENGIFLYKYNNKRAQEIGLVEQIKALHNAGVPYAEMAVIYREHKDATDILKYLAVHNIPYNARKKVDILQQPEIIRIINIMRYIYGEYKYVNSRKDILFEILHYDFFKNDALDIGKIALLSSQTNLDDDNVSWRAQLLDDAALEKLDLHNSESIKQSVQILESLIRAIPNVTTQTLFEKILTNTGMLDFILKSDNSTWRLQLINKLFDFIKNETAQSGDLTGEGILASIDKRLKFEIDLPITNIISTVDGINFMTAHGSKGLEFDHVFILSAVKNLWVDKKTNNNVSFPPNLTKTEDDSSIEDDRRLFFVALTRARKKANIFFPIQNEKNKDLECATFVYEMGIDVEGTPITEISENQMTGYLSTVLSYHEKSTILIDKNLIDLVLENLQINATGISKYLKCPRTFYFENILRIPSARKASPGFGNALHYAFEKFFYDIKSKGMKSHGSLGMLLDFFEKGMYKFKSHFTADEYQSHLYDGKEILKQYFEEHKETWLMANDYLIEYKIQSEIDGIPISGIIDRVADYGDHIDIYDYKTGSYKTDDLAKPTDLKPGGKYWRQAVFYKLLLDKDVRFKGKINKAKFHYLIKDEETKTKEYNISPQEEDIVINQIKDVYENIKNYKFETGCNECAWCSFVNDHMGVDQVVSEVVIEEEEM